jgi:hypothetical protein
MSPDETAPDARVTLPVQPTPWATGVAYLQEGSTVVTIISRWWRPGEPGRCGLCPRCVALKDVCTVGVKMRVERSAAPLFSTRELLDSVPGPLRPRVEGLAGSELRLYRGDDIPGQALDCRPGIDPIGPDHPQDGDLVEDR